MLACLPWTVFAQEKDFSRFEVSVSMGGGWVMQDRSVDGGRPAMPFSPAFDVAFMYFPKAWLSFGLAVGNDRDVFSISRPTRMIDLTPYVRFHWFRRDTFSFYSGLGYSFVIPYLFKDTTTAGKHPWYESIQVNPVGVTFGRSVFGFAELGLGPRQVIPPLRVGIGYRF